MLDRLWAPRHPKALSKCPCTDFSVEKQTGAGISLPNPNMGVAGPGWGAWLPAKVLGNLGREELPPFGETPRVPRLLATSLTLSSTGVFTPGPSTHPSFCGTFRLSEDQVTQLEKRTRGVRCCCGHAGPSVHTSPGESPVTLRAAGWPVQPCTPGAWDLSYLVTKCVHPQLCVCAWDWGLHLAGLCMLTS